MVTAWARSRPWLCRQPVYRVCAELTLTFQDCSSVVYIPQHTFLHLSGCNRPELIPHLPRCWLADSKSLRITLVAFLHLSGHNSILHLPRYESLNFMVLRIPELIPHLPWYWHKVFTHHSWSFITANSLICWLDSSPIPFYLFYNSISTICWSSLRPDCFTVLGD